MRKAFVAVAALVMLAVVVQFFLAASGAFDSAPNEEAFRPHRSLGYLIVLLSVVLTLVAAIARMPSRIIGMSGLVAGLAVLQPVIAVIARAFGDTGETSTAGNIVFGLHAINALIMMGVARNVLKAARELDAPANAARAGSAAG